VLKTLLAAAAIIGALLGIAHAQLSTQQMRAVILAHPPAASGSVIKHIEQGSITIGSTSLTGTYTLAGSYAVNAANTILIWDGRTTTTNSAALYERVATRITLTNSTTVTATRENSTDSVTVYFTVVEFASGVNSVQYGTVPITATNTSGTTTLGSAVGSNAFVIWLGASVQTASQHETNVVTGVSLNTGTHVVTATIGVADPTDTITTNFVVVDLDSSIVSGIQQIATTSTAASGIDTASISPISTASTVLFYGGVINAFGAGADVNIADYTQELAASAVTFTRNQVTNTISRTHYFTAVSFNPGVIKSLQRGTIPIPAATSQPATLATSVDTTKTFVNWGNFQSAASVARTTQPNLVLTNTNTVTASVNTAGSPTVAYEAVEFK
jgi:hypothetical protein